VEFVALLSQGRTAAAQCDLFTHKSVLIIFEPPCIFCVVDHQYIIYISCVECCVFRLEYMLYMCVSRCCRNISATVLEIGDPIEIPFSGWYVLFWKEK